MNDLLVKKAKSLQEKMLKHINRVLKSMGWGVIIPPELLTIILDFLCHSFLKPPSLFLPVPVPCPATPNTQYILESQSTIIMFQTRSEWCSIKSLSMLQVQSSQKRFREFIRNNCKFGERPRIIGSKHDGQLLERMITHFKERATTSIAVMEILRVLVNKNILCIRDQGWTTFIIENKDPFHIISAMHGKVFINYDARKETYMINCVRAWQKGRKLSRKKQIVRLSRSTLVQIQGNEVEQLPMDYFDPNDPEYITHRIS